jgi:cation diffusion facilitator CzcD-associated flavoprotein CzcO
MFLRSSADWHLDPMGVHTLRAYLRERELDPRDVDPVPLELFLAYGRWFAERKAIHPGTALVARLERRGHRFEARLEDGAVVEADAVLLAPGFRPFRNFPDELVARLPEDRFVHSCDVSEPAAFRGRRVLIVGGRQSAFETAALISEGGGAHVHLVYRHDTPRFERSDWSWAEDMVKRFDAAPNWFHVLRPEEQKAVGDRLWVEGRLKLEPWLGPRIDRAGITLHPRTEVVSCDEAGGELRVQLSTGASVAVDSVVLATGYRVRVDRIPYLSRDSILPTLATDDGFPVLDDSFQTSVPGLFLTGLPASRRFGPFFGFVLGCTASARIIVDALWR